MKLLDKLKNTFFEEEYIEVEEPEVKTQTVAKKIEPKEIKKESKKPTVVEEKMEELEEEKPIIDSLEEELPKKDTKIPYFEEEDFIEVDLKENKKEEPKKLYGESSDKLYQSINYNSLSSNKPYGSSTREGFKPTPIISPIYGILDKNYKKEEVVDKKDKVGTHSSYVSRKNADLDSIRMKAFGGLEPLEGIKSTSTPEEEIEADIEEDSSLLYDMTDDNATPVVDKVTIADAEEYFDDLGLEYNIDYKDNRYEKANGRRTSSTSCSKDIKENEPDMEQEEANLGDNLFDIIDSMDEEGEE